MKSNALLASLALALFASIAVAGDWNQWRGAQRDGVAHGAPPLIGELPSDGLKPKWLSAPIPGGSTGGWSSPTVVGNRIYLYSHSKVRKPGAEKIKRKHPWLAPNKRGHLSAKAYAEYEIKRRNEDEAIANGYTFDESVYCIDLQTGKTLWRAQHPSVYTRFVHSSTIAAFNGKLYVLGAARTAHCLDAETGQWLWHTKIPGAFRDEFHGSSFAVAEGVAVVMCGDLVGLNADTGKLMWMGDEKNIQGTHTSPTVMPVAGKRTWIVANVARGKTACVDPQTGKPQWTVETGAGHSTPIVVGDRMITYGATRKAGLRCFKVSPDKAEPLWTYTGTADAGGSPVVMGDRVYVTGEYHMACVDLATGQAKWTKQLDLERPRYASLIGADGKIFYAWSGLYCIEASDEFNLLYDGKIDGAGVMGTLETHKHLIDYNQLVKDKGLDKADKTLQSKVLKKGPQTTSTPVIAQGLILTRTAQGLVCHDLRKNKP